jgi:hypothetical protein
VQAQVSGLLAQGLPGDPRQTVRPVLVPCAVLQEGGQREPVELTGMRAERADRLADLLPGLVAQPHVEQNDIGGPARTHEPLDTSAGQIDRVKRAGNARRTCCRSAE